jgi:DNA-binding CsgD family transcriptional regulator
MKEPDERDQFCLAQLERVNEKFRTGESQAALAEARGIWFKAKKKLQESVSQFQQSAVIWQSITRYDQARALASLGGALKAAGELTGANAAFQQAFDIYGSLAAQLDPDRQATFLDSRPVRDARLALEALSHGKRRRNGSSDLGALTGREIEVLKLVAQGLTNAQIAEQLVLSPLTVNAHLRSIFNKLDVANRTTAVHQALELGLV